MRVYFVRHGASRLHGTHVFQYPHTELGTAGTQQAKQAARRLQERPISRVLSGPLPRATQSADIIARRLRMPVEHSSLFSEIQKPSALIGVPRTDPRIAQFDRQWTQNAHRPDRRYLDEETFLELKERALQACSYLLGYAHTEHIVVVTHGGMLRTMVLAMIYGDELSIHEFVRFFRRLQVTYGGITVCDHTHERGWQLVSWNESTHLV